MAPSIWVGSARLCAVRLRASCPKQSRSASQNRPHKRLVHPREFIQLIPACKGLANHACGRVLKGVAHERLQVCQPAFGVRAAEGDSTSAQRTRLASSLAGALFPCSGASRESSALLTVTWTLSREDMPTASPCGQIASPSLASCLPQLLRWFSNPGMTVSTAKPLSTAWCWERRGLRALTAFTAVDSAAPTALSGFECRCTAGLPCHVRCRKLASSPGIADAGTTIAH